MKLLRSTAFFLAVLVMLVACVTISEPDQSRKFTLVYSGNLDGELEPCGCSEGGDLGGIKRQVNMIDQLRHENPDLFLISTGGLLISTTPQDQLTSEYILKGLGAFGYDAMGVQWRDLAFGKDYLSRFDLPFVVSNLSDAAFSTDKLIRRGGNALAYFQWLDPAADPQRLMQGEHSLASDNIEALRHGIAVAKDHGAVTVLASTLTLEEARQQLPLDAVDILIIKAGYEVYGEPQHIGKMLVIQPGSRGMRLGRLDITANADGDIQKWRHEVIALPKAVGDAPRMSAWYEEYNARVKDQYEKSVVLRKAREGGESPYVGDQMCQNCHEQEHAVWSKTRHAEAFYTLQNVNKAFDPNCIICHTVGFDKAGGFIDPDTTPALMHVQCESCHGAARAHSESSGAKPVSNAAWSNTQICAQCHTQPHSPQFNFDSYWPKIAHGIAVQSR